MNISSVIVLVKPENLEKSIELLGKIQNCQYHMHSDEGKIILSIETQSLDEEINTFKQIEQTQNIISAQMVYAYNDEDMHANLKDDIVLKTLENDDANSIKYGGSLHHVMNKDETKH